jgi:pyruvate,water dikinase
VTASTRPLAELRRDDAAEFGGKSANLGELMAAGVQVPSGFAIGAGAYRDFVRGAGLDGTIAAAISRSDDDASKTIGEAMRFAPLAEPLRAELASGYSELGEPPVAVRSSALGEDGSEATFAGQQESFLWIRGIEHLCDAVQDCWASLHTPRAIAYRRRLRATGEAMGVTVQEMVDARVSGVLFTCNPVSGDPSMVAVNANWGLGIAVVGGETTPDDYLVSKVTGEVVRRTVASKQVEYVPDAAGRGTLRVEIPEERREQPCLDDEQLASLVDVGRRIETHFGSHQDVEWAIDRDGALLVLQARPVTAMTQASPKLSGSALSLVMDTFGAAPVDGEDECL